MSRLWLHRGRLAILSIALLVGIATIPAPGDAHTNGLRFGNRSELVATKHGESVWLANRFSMTMRVPATDERSLELTPFIELTYTDTQHDLDKVEGGIECGFPITRNLITALAAQAVTTPHSNLRSELVSDHAGSNGTVELTGLLAFTYPLPFALLTKPALLLASEAYVYDPRFGEGSRNEVAAGVAIALNQHWQTGLVWRHIDLIHATDSDEIVALAAVTF